MLPFYIFYVISCFVSVLQFAYFVKPIIGWLKAGCIVTTYPIFSRAVTVEMLNRFFDDNTSIEKYSLKKKCVN